MKKKNYNLPETTVLITGAGAPGAPGIIKSLRLNGERNIRIIGVDANISTSVGVGMVDKSYQVPLASSPDFIDTIIDICRKEDVKVVIPLVTMELFSFSKHKSDFLDQGITVQVSDNGPLETANNKHLLFEFCAQTPGIPCPEFSIVNSLDEFITEAQQLGYPSRQICFKPPVSNGLRGFRIIDDSSNKMQKLMNEKPNNIYIGFDEFIQIAKDADFFPEVLLMEYLPGKEYSVDVLADNGKCIHVIPRTRDHIKMGISFAGTAVQNPIIEKASVLIVEKLKLNGNIGLQFKENQQEIPCIIECNPRVQGTIVLCTAAGCNMVYNSVKLGLKESLPEQKIKWGTRMVRFWDEQFFDQSNTPFRLE